PIFKLTKINGIGYGAWYYTPLQGYKWLKSSFEIAFAEYLDQHNILWYYECKTFPMKIIVDDIEKQTSYTPDFYLPETNEFIDTKGWFKLESKLKVSKFHEMFSVYLKILFEQDLINLGINLKYYTNNKKSKIVNKKEISYESSLEELIKEYIKVK
ncbi:MAG: hypothetical protein Q8N08_03560, partial [Methanobacteriaceae archaeon]|nr:hypothetical protein [Methanobacteriaceae archaeon]